MSETPVSDGSPVTPGSSRILDRRYQQYTGPRKGPGHATWRLSVHVFQRLMGLRRPVRYKIVPLLLALACFIFPLGLIALAAFIPGGSSFTFSYAQMYEVISLPVFIFIAITAPTSLIADRKQKSLSLYLASPLSRNTYLLAHAAAVAAVVFVVTAGPLLLYFISLVVQGTGPDGLTGFGSDLWRILASGIGISVLSAAIAMVVGALAERPSIAASTIFIGLTVLSALTTGAAEQLDSQAVRLLSVGDLDNQLILQIFDHDPGFGIKFGLGAATIVGAIVAWTAICVAITWWRYRRLVVSR